MESDEGVGGALSCVRACLSLFFAVGCVHDEPDIEKKLRSAYPSSPLKREEQRLLKASVRRHYILLSSGSKAPLEQTRLMYFRVTNSF